MITKMEISDYRSCVNTELNLQPDLTVLIGPNGCGKTNILNALLLLRKLAIEEEPYRHRQSEAPSGECTIKTWFKLETGQVIHTASIGLDVDENNKDVVNTSRHKWYVKDYTGSAKRLQIPLWLVSRLDEPHGVLSRHFHRRPDGRYFYGNPKWVLPEIATKPLRDIVLYLTQMKYYSASQFTNPSNCPVSFEIETEGRQSRGLRARGHTKFLVDLFMEWQAKDRSRYEQFFDIVGPSGIKLIDKIDFQEIPTSSVDYSVRSGGKVRQIRREKSLVIPQFTIGSHVLSPNQLSEGTFKTVTLLFYLITESSSMMLIEEPEVCVHHGLLSSIMELIKSYSRERQIVVSTHSDLVLDKVEPRNVYKVQMNGDQGTQITHVPFSMSQKELSALHMYLETEGNLGEYWKRGGLE